MPLDSAEDRNVPESLFPSGSKISSFKPSSISPTRNYFVGRGEDEA